jgi:MFS family permease
MTGTACEAPASGAAESVLAPADISTVESVGSVHRAAEVSTSRPSAALAACLLAGFATLFDSAAITYATPTVAALGGGTAGVQWLLASFSFTFGLGLAPAGRLGDAYGRRTLFAIGMGVFVLGGLASVLAPSMPMLIGARLLQGLGAGTISAQVLGAIQDLFRGPERLRALSFYTGTGALAALLGPLGAGLTLGTIGPDLAWRIVLLLPLPFAAAAIGLGLRGLPRGSTAGRSSRLSLDLPAVVMLAGIVVLLTLPVVRTGTDPTLVIAAPIIAAVCAGLLALWERSYERRGRLPLFARELVRSRGFLSCNVVALLWFGSNLSVTSVVTIHLLQVTTLTPLLVAALFAPAALARLLSSLLSGRVFTALGPRGLLLGLTAQSTLLLVMALFAPHLGVLPLAFATATVQVGLGLCSGVIEPSMRVVTLSYATGRTHGVAASFLQLTQRLSATALVALTTGILLGVSGTATGARLGAALGVCAAASAIALLVALDRSVRRWREPGAAKTT